MFARVSTYETGPETISDAPSDDVMNTVLEIPGFRGVYYLHGKGTGKDLSITLWDSEESMVASRETANRIRTETSAAQRTQILAVEEFEVTASSLKD